MRAGGTVCARSEGTYISFLLVVFILLAGLLDNEMQSYRYDD